MDCETRRQYLLARFYGYGREVVELGYRYFHHLARPDLPLKETLRQLPVVDYEDARPGGVPADGDEDFSDDEMIYSDDDESFCSHMSDVTHESELAHRVFESRPCPVGAISDTSPGYSLLESSVDRI